MTGASAPARVYFDSNFWIKHYWSKHSSESTRTVNARKLPFDLESLSKEKFNAYFTEYLFYEISAHIKDWELIQLVINDGFSYREFTKLKNRPEYRIDEEGQKRIDDALANLSSYPCVVPDLTPKPITEEEVAFLFSLTRYGLEIIDSFHIISAVRHDCNYFVTSDEGIIEGINIAKKAGLSNLKNLIIMKPEQFKGKFNL